jgi:hypothetical protein
VDGQSGVALALDVEIVATDVRGADQVGVLTRGLRLHRAVACHRRRDEESRRPSI